VRAHRIEDGVVAADELRQPIERDGLREHSPEQRRLVRARESVTLAREHGERRAEVWVLPHTRHHAIDERTDIDRRAQPLSPQRRDLEFVVVDGGPKVLDVWLLR
jgi:hypothetical protein